jgi:hypothetical protein
VRLKEWLRRKDGEAWESASVEVEILRTREELSYIYIPSIFHTRGIGSSGLKTRSRNYWIYIRSTDQSISMTMPVADRGEYHSRVLMGRTGEDTSKELTESLNFQLPICTV